VADQYQKLKLSQLLYTIFHCAQRTMPTDRPKSTVRVHGMQAPFHPLQILTWIIYPLLIVQFFLLVMPLLNSLAVQIITACIFGISSIAALVAGGVTATIDPSGMN
jgi:hypothetical protein